MVVAYGTSVKGRDLVVYAAQPLGDVHEAVDDRLPPGAHRDPAAGADHRHRHLPRRGAGAAAGRGDPRPGRHHPGPLGAGAGAPGPRRGRPAGRDDERHARPAAGGRRPCSAASSRTRATSCAVRSRRSPPAWSCCRATASGRPPTATRSPPCAGETARLGRLVDALLLLARADESGLRPRLRGRRPRRGGRGGAAAARRRGSSPGSRRRTCGWSATGGSSPRWCATSSTTPAGTPARLSWSRCGAPTGTRSSTSPTTGRACRPTSGRACSSGSSASTTPGRGRTAAPGWGSPSSRRSSRRTAARWTSSAARWAGPCSGCGCRCPPTRWPSRRRSWCRTRPSPPPRPRRRPAAEPAAARGAGLNPAGYTGVGSAIR